MYIIGKCSICGGSVAYTLNSDSTGNIGPRCTNCGAVPQAYDRVIPMKAADPVAPYSSKDGTGDVPLHWAHRNDQTVPDTQ